MGMLMRRHYDNSFSKATGATEKVAPKPTLNKKEEVKPVVKEETPEVKITRSDIMKMNVATVRAYAEQQGIEGADSMSGAELKRILGDKLFEESE